MEKKVESIMIDAGKDVKFPTLVLKTATQICRVPLETLNVVCEERSQDELKNLMDEIGENISGIASKLHEHLAEKRTEVLKGLREWIDKELQ